MARVGFYLPSHEAEKKTFHDTFSHIPKRSTQEDKTYESSSSLSQVQDVRELSRVCRFLRNSFPGGTHSLSTSVSLIRFSTGRGKESRTRVSPVFQFFTVGPFCFPILGSTPVEKLPSRQRYQADIEMSD